MTHASPMARGGPAQLPTAFGSFIAYAYDGAGGAQHAAIVKGAPADSEKPVLARVHSSCVTGDIFASRRCDCGAQLNAAMHLIEREGVGVVVYLDQEGRGIGLTSKIQAYVLQDGGLDTVEANEALGFAPDERRYGDAAQIINDLGIAKVRLLTNNPRKVEALRSHGVQIAERVPLMIEPNPHNRDYLGVKAAKLGHLLPERDD